MQPGLHRPRPQTEGRRRLGLRQLEQIATHDHLAQVGREVPYAPQQPIPADGIEGVVRDVADNSTRPRLGRQPIASDPPPDVPPILNVGVGGRR